MRLRWFVRSTACVDYFLRALNELGFEGEEAEMRAMTLVASITWDSHTFGYISRKKRRAMIGRRIELLTSKTE